MSTPRSKEEYMYRDIFSKHFPSPAACRTVPQVQTSNSISIFMLSFLQNKSIACSTPTALAWDEAWSKAADPSGRAVAGVHLDAYNGE